MSIKPILKGIGKSVVSAFITGVGLGLAGEVVEGVKGLVKTHIEKRKNENEKENNPKDPTPAEKTGPTA